MVFCKICMHVCMVFDNTPYLLLCAHLGLLCLADLRQGHLKQHLLIHPVQQAAAVDLNITPVAPCGATHTVATAAAAAAAAQHT
jgi:hypothetical protein